MITIDPASISLPANAELPMQVDCVVTNHGLIAGSNSTFTWNDTEHLRITPLTNVLGDIPAMTSYTLPIHIDWRTPPDGSAVCTQRRRSIYARLEINSDTDVR